MTGRSPRDQHIIALARDGVGTDEIARRFALRVNRVQQIIRVGKLRAAQEARHGTGTTGHEDQADPLPPL